MILALILLCAQPQVTVYSNGYVPAGIKNYQLVKVNISTPMIKVHKHTCICENCKCSDCQCVRSSAPTVRYTPRVQFTPLHTQLMRYPVCRTCR